MPQNNTVSFNNILVNTVNTNAGVFVGTNTQSSWNSVNNNKYGFGNVIGAGNVVSHGINIFMDNDMIDTPIITNNYNGGKQPNAKNSKDNVVIYGCRRGRRERL